MGSKPSKTVMIAAIECALLMIELIFGLTLAVKLTDAILMQNLQILMGYGWTDSSAETPPKS
jgi:hypothetical protein